MNLTMMNLTKFSLMMFLCAVMAACGSESKRGEAAHVRLSLSHLANTSRAGKGMTPTYFGVKFISIALQTDKDIKLPIVSSSIYVNADCGNADAKFTLDGKEYEYVGSPACKTSDMGNFFDLAAASADANDVLDSQIMPVIPGSYKYVTLGICNETPDANNLRFTVPGMDAVEAKVPACGLYSTEMSPPLVLEEAQSAEVTLAYDLTGVVIPTDKVVADSCAKQTSGVVLCATIPTFDPSYEKNRSESTLF